MLSMLIFSHGNTERACHLGFTIRSALPCCMDLSSMGRVQMSVTEFERSSLRFIIFVLAENSLTHHMYAIHCVLHHPSLFLTVQNGRPLNIHARRLLECM